MAMHRVGLALLAGLLFTTACGRDEPQLFAVVRTDADADKACLPLRAPSLADLDAAQLGRLRVADDEYFWLVGESVVGPGGLDGFLSSLSRRSALVSLTAAAGGRASTRAVATIEGGAVTHTYFGTPLTPAFAQEPGTQLALTFDARQLDAPALSAAKAVLGAVPLETPAYLKLLTAVAPGAAERPDSAKSGLAQTWVLRDPRACPSGACQAVIADERLVLLSASPGRSALELASELCLDGTRLQRRDAGDEHGGAYAVMRVAHARLPEEALGDALAQPLAALARCDREFTPELAARAQDQLSRAESLRPADRELLRSVLADVAFTANALTPEATLAAEQRLARSTERLCGATPADGIVCARARSLSACASARAAPARVARAAFGTAATAISRAENATSGSCESRGQALVALARDLGTLAAASHEAGLGGTCVATSLGLACESFPELSRRSRAVIGETQELLYRQCWCGTLRDDRAPLAAARLVREALRCESAPEEFTLSPAAEAPLREDDLVAFANHRAELVPALTAQQCPACVRLARRIDEELSRSVALGRSQAAVAGLLRRALTPVVELRDRALVLMTGDAAVRCSERPDEWAVIAEALDYTVEPRDLFRDGGQLDPARLEAKLRRAELLRSSLDGLPCARAEGDGTVEAGASLATAPR